MCLQLVVGLVVIALQRSIFDGSIHSFHLAVSPWMTNLGQAVFDAVGVADTVKGNGPIVFRTLPFGKLDAVIGQDRMDGIWHCRNEITEKVSRSSSRCLGVKFHIGEF